MKTFKEFLVEQKMEVYREPYKLKHENAPSAEEIHKDSDAADHQAMNNDRSKPLHVLDHRYMRHLKTIHHWGEYKDHSENNTHTYHVVHTDDFYQKHKDQYK